MNVKLISLLVIMCCVAVVGCDKYNQVDNLNTAKVPYVLYIGGYDGKLYKTNDALYFNTLFHTDNSPLRHIATADSNLIYVKKNAYVSKNEGKSFEEAKPITVATLPWVDEFYKYFIPNGIVYQNSRKKVFLCGGSSLMESTDWGKTFNSVSNWASATTIVPKSITHLSNDDLFIMKDSSTNVFRLMPGVSSNWTQVNAVTALPTDTNSNSRNKAGWYLAHLVDTLFAVDYIGQSGVYQSKDFGLNWTTTTGLPNAHKILCANTPTGFNNMFVGFDSAGMYKLNGSAFTQVGNGIPWYAKISAIEGKEVIYRTNVSKKYLFCATDVGLFMSENAGVDWRLVRAGNFSTLQ